jgi:hypothetical protein
MPSAKFIEDRRRTYAAQEYVAEKLMGQGFDARIVPDGNFPYYDIEAKHPDGRWVFVEVKRDYGFKKSGNFCIEIDSLMTKAAPRGKDLLLAMVVDDPDMLCYFCDLKSALKIAMDYPVKGAWGDHGEISALVPKKHLASHLKLYKLT